MKSNQDENTQNDKKPEVATNNDGLKSNSFVQKHPDKDTDKPLYFQSKIRDVVIIDIGKSRHFYHPHLITHAVFANGELNYKMSGKKEKASGQLGRILCAALSDYYGKEFING